MNLLRRLVDFVLVLAVLIITIPCYMFMAAILIVMYGSPWFVLWKATLLFDGTFDLFAICISLFLGSICFVEVYMFGKFVKEAIEEYNKLKERKT